MVSYSFNSAALFILLATVALLAGGVALVVWVAWPRRAGDRAARLPVARPVRPGPPAVELVPDPAPAAASGTGATPFFVAANAWFAVTLLLLIGQWDSGGGFYRLFGYGRIEQPVYWAIVAAGLAAAAVCFARWVRLGGGTAESPTVLFAAGQAWFFAGLTLLMGMGNVDRPHYTLFGHGRILPAVYFGVLYGAFAAGTFAFVRWWRPRTPAAPTAYQDAARIGLVGVGLLGLWAFVSLAGRRGGPDAGGVMSAVIVVGAVALALALVAFRPPRPVAPAPIPARGPRRSNAVVVALSAVVLALGLFAVAALSFESGTGALFALGSLMVALVVGLLLLWVVLPIGGTSGSNRTAPATQRAAIGLLAVLTGGFAVVFGAVFGLPYGGVAMAMFAAIGLIAGVGVLALVLAGKASPPRAASSTVPVAVPVAAPPPPLPVPEEPRPCPRCGAPIAAGSPAGLCPRCLLGDLLPPSADRTSPYAGPDPAPAVEDVAAFFPHLEVIRLLGEGGMGAVYLARQPALDRLVALKLIRTRGDDPAFAERFAREARAMARLNHPHIVAVYDTGQAGGLPYLVMEYVGGVTLRDAMRNKSLTPAAALAVIPQVCDALEYAHTQGVVHRDVKPENILLDAAGRVKIADFGLAKVTDPGGVSLTRTHQAMGTPHYMAPEQWERPAEVDHRADIYALGVVLYELLTGELPLGRFDPPSVKARIDARIDELVLRALAKEPARRYQHAGDVKRALEGWKAGGGWPPAAAVREYRSRATFLGWPLVHIASGRDPATGRSVWARGWVAVGSVNAKGVIAVGGVNAVGVVALGGANAVGGLAVGGAFSIGAAAVAGGGALGLVVAAAGWMAAAAGLAVAGGVAAGTSAVAGWLGFGFQVIDATRQHPFANPLDVFSDRVLEPLVDAVRGRWGASR